MKEHATRPEEASFFSIDNKGVVMTGMKQSEDGNELIVRLCEVEGKETTVNVTVPVNVSSARRLNIIELSACNAAAPVVNGKTIQVKDHGRMRLLHLG